ncbi:phage tail assembly protein [Rhizobium sp. SSA_523]|uniref:phage tail assembly protein n=1 Tax=Rhizobium sp. SSA_523 TaxID=2952477 RepID=UPI00209163B0|nr:phage tail assembly protein [Rhizobium sp. SSA_523]MCO5730070.1 phage tail assembly protein [Rhizobium sp. SSA_523]WKC25136.1 phage tail assembly protein [Rhizobium sp. SSA_523]
MADQVTRALTPEQIAAIESSGRKNSGGFVEPKLIPQNVRDVTQAHRVRFVEQEGKARQVSVSLDFPVEVDGKLIDEVTIRRPSMREWRQYIRDCLDAVKKYGPGADDLVDQVWVSVPAAVLEELDFTDVTRVEAAQDGFFGRSTLPQETEEETSGSKSETGESSPSS